MTQAQRNSLLAAFALLALLPAAAWAHDISAANRAAVEGLEGPHFLLFAYLGAKHMVTGIDHVLYLIGVVFFLFKFTTVNAHIVDAVIGLSVVYKAVENLGGFKKLGWNFDPRLAVLAFGLAHGLGLATKLQDLSVSANGLLVNLIGFNVGVEIGQVLVLAVVVFLLNLWRRLPSFEKGALGANCVLLAAGLLLAGQQIAEYLAE
jgi:hypothetical protein